MSTASATPLLQVRDLHKAFGGVCAVDGVSFDVHAGEVVALIGPNGAGKSTTFHLLNGQLVPDTGTVTLAGEAITGCPPERLATRGVGRTFQTAQTLASFSVLENVQVALLAADGLSTNPWPRAQAHRRAQALALLEQVGLQAHAARACTALAYADLKRLELAMALAGEPRLLLMDEPTAGMAATERQTLMALVRRLVRERGLGVLLTEHSMDVVFGHADRVLVMARGRLIAQGTPAQVQANPEVQAVYLGPSGATP